MTSFLQQYTLSNSVVQSEHSHFLTIQRSLDGLSIVIFDNKEQKFVRLSHYLYSEKNISLKTLLDELQEKENWKLSDFGKVTLIIDNNENTLVPSKYFQEENIESYLNLLNIGKEKNLRHDTLNSCDIENVYSINDDVVNTIAELQTEIEVRHSSSILIENIIREFSERSQETRVFVNVKNNSYELAIINKSKLVFHNYFNFNTKEDFLYFLLFTFEQLKIDNETTPLYFMGFIEEKSAIVELCSRYIRNIRFINRNNDLNYTEELDSIPYYYYHVLYSSVLCE